MLTTWSIISSVQNVPINHLHDEVTASLTHQTSPPYPTLLLITAQVYQGMSVSYVGINLCSGLLAVVTQLLTWPGANYIVGMVAKADASSV